MPLRLLLALAALVAALPGPAGAQVDVATNVGFFTLDEVGRFGVGAAVFIPLYGYAFDIVPNGEYYFGKWSVDADTSAATVYTVALDGHANLPELVQVVRPYVGAGVVYAGHGGDGAFGLDLKTGFYLRALGWRLTPYGQVTYRVLPEFESAAALDTYFFQGGLRFGL